MARTDNELLRAARRDPEAFGEFYDRHATSLLAWATRQTRESDLALEVVAETFAQALLAVHRFRGVRENSSAAWLRTIARRLLIHMRECDRLERRARERLGTDGGTVQDAFEEIVDRRFDPPALSVDEVLTRFPQQQADAVRLRVVEELSYNEIARRLDCSSVAARLRVSRALRTLRAQLGASVR